MRDFVNEDRIVSETDKERRKRLGNEHRRINFNPSAGVEANFLEESTPTSVNYVENLEIGRRRKKKKLDDEESTTKVQASVASQKVPNVKDSSNEQEEEVQSYRGILGMFRKLGDWLKNGSRKNEASRLKKGRLSEEEFKELVKSYKRQSPVSMIQRLSMGEGKPPFFDKSLDAKTNGKLLRDHLGSDDRFYAYQVARGNISEAQALELRKSKGETLESNNADKNVSQETTNKVLDRENPKAKIPDVMFKSRRPDMVSDDEAQVEKAQKTEPLVLKNPDMSKVTEAGNGDVKAVEVNQKPLKIGYLSPEQGGTKANSEEKIQFKPNSKQNILFKRGVAESTKAHNKARSKKGSYKPGKGRDYHLGI